jgi:hypothetical protein
MDATFEQTRRAREIALKAFAETAVRSRVQATAGARPRTVTEFRADDIVMIWKTKLPSKRGQWVGPGVVIGVHHNSVWVNMRGHLWKCSAIQCRKATNTEHSGLLIVNELLQDMKVRFREFPGRQTYVDVEREGPPPSDASVVPEPAAPEMASTEPSLDSSGSSATRPSAGTADTDEPMPDEVPMTDPVLPVAASVASNNVARFDLTRLDGIKRAGEDVEGPPPALSSTGAPVVESGVRWRRDTDGSWHDADTALWCVRQTDVIFERGDGVPIIASPGELEQTDGDHTVSVAVGDEAGNFAVTLRND